MKNVLLKFNPKTVGIIRTKFLWKDRWAMTMDFWDYSYFRDPYEVTKKGFNVSRRQDLIRLRIVPKNPKVANGEWTDLKFEKKLND